MISSLIPSILFLLLALIEPPDLALPLDDVDDAEDCELDVFDELGDDVDALLLFVLLEFAALLALLLLLLFELPLLPPLEDPPPRSALPDDEEDPPDCFSFLSLIILCDTILLFTQFLMCNTFSLSLFNSLYLAKLFNINFSLYYIFCG